MSAAVLLHVREMLKVGSEDSGDEPVYSQCTQQSLTVLSHLPIKQISLFNVLCTKYSSSPQEHATQVEMRVSIAHIH